MNPWPSKNRRIWRKRSNYYKGHHYFLAFHIYGSEIYSSGITIRPSNPTRGRSYLERSSFFKPSPLNRSGYMTSAPLPWSINTFFTIKPFIWALTTKASLCGWIVPSRLSSLKAMSSWVGFNFFSEGYSFGQLSTGTTANTPLLLVTRVTLEIAWMTSITPNEGGRGFLQGRVPCSASWFLRSTTNSFQYPALTPYIF